MNSYITEEYQIRDILEEKRIKLEAFNLIYPRILKIGREIQEVFKGEEGNYITKANDGDYFKKFRDKINKIVDDNYKRIRSLEQIDKTTYTTHLYFDRKGLLKINMKYKKDLIETVSEILKFKYRGLSDDDDRILESLRILELKELDIEKELKKLEEYLRACIVANNLKRKVMWEIQK